MRHFVIVGVLIVIVSVLVYVGLNAIGLMPVEASSQSLIVDWMWNTDLIVLCFLFALILVPLIYSVVVFRQRKGENESGEYIAGNSKLEVTWTLLPVMLVIVFAYLGAYTYGQTRAPEPNPLVINVVGHQWDWIFNYQEGFSSKELHIPVNHPVHLKMQSLDVIHSFWVPEFRVKQDVLPGRITDYLVTPILIGNYKVRCAELCGLRHTYMEEPVIVSTQADYDAWVKVQAAAAAALQAQGGPANGQAQVAKYGCGGCHSIDGSRLVGPTWQGLYLSKVPLENGTAVTADEAYLTFMIANPNVKIVAGYPANVMPKFDLTDAQIKDIVSYIETLK